MLDAFVYLLCAGIISAPLAGNDLHSVVGFKPKKFDLVHQTVFL